MDQGWAIVIAALIGVGGTLLGVFIGGQVSAGAAKEAAKIAAAAARDAARLAQEESRADREEIQRARFANDTRQQAALLLRGAEDHVRQVATQVTWRWNPLVPRKLPAEMPQVRVGSTDALYLTVAELHLTTRLTATADAAWRMYQAAVFIGDHFTATPQDVDDDGLVTAIDKDGYQEWDAQAKRFAAQRTEYINAVRTEFGVSLFGEGETPPGRTEPNHS